MSDDRSNPRQTGSRGGNASPRSGGDADATHHTGTNNADTGHRRREFGSYPHLFAPGARVGRYRLLAPLASGGMAQVWAAKPEGTGFARTVALKLIRQEYAADEEYARMFIDEATVAASIRHPNVCETYELGKEDGVLFMAIEWVAGDSLAGILHREQGLEPLSCQLAARVVADACAGLHEAHEAVGPDGVMLGVVHRDVSPPNILLSLHGQVKVSDFGIAKARFQLHSKTRTGEIKGKFAYIAPEQIGGKNIDRRVDIFALGCVLYVATVGLRPFGSGPRAMSKILSGEYKAPSSLLEGYPPELERIIARCLQKFPADRYATADEMRTDLERWLITGPTPIGTRDIAAVVSQRLDPAKRKVVETLMRSNQFLPDAMVYQLVRGEVDKTPTATSSVMFGPGSVTGLDVAVPVEPARSKKALPKPMVRFTALGRPITPSTTDEIDPELARDTDSGDAVPSAPPGDSTDVETMTSQEGLSSFLPSSQPAPKIGEPAPTFRPPRLAPLRTGAHKTDGGTVRAQLWTAAGVIVAIVVGWASCQLLPP